MPEALHMRPSMSTLIIAALNLAHDYIYYLTLRIHSNDCDILELCHEIQSYLLYPATPAFNTKIPGTPSQHPQQCDQTDLETLPLGQTAGPRHRFR
jgi:hypothetical protein